MKKIKNIIASRLSLTILFGLLWGITAIYPDLLTDARIFINYIGYIILNAVVQEKDKSETEKKIDKLTKDIEFLKNNREGDKQ